MKRRRTFWAVDYRFGMILVHARSAKEVLQKVTITLGDAVKPYTIAKDQKRAIAWARAMGARTIV